MKKLILITAALLLVAGTNFGQTLQKGNLVGFHVGTVILDPDVTSNQFNDFYLNKYIPELEKQFQGDIKVYLAVGDRGDDENLVGAFWVFKSVEVRDKYFSQEGTMTELFNSKMEKIQPIHEELNKLGIYSEKHYTDWVIQ